VTVAVVLLGVVVALLAVLVVSLLRSHAEILRALHDLGIDLDPATPQDQARAARVARATGTTSPAAPAATDPPFTTVDGVPAPAELLGMGASDLAGTDSRGDAVAIGVVGAPQRTLLAFLTSGCTTCRGFWTAFGHGVDLPAPDIRLVIVTKGEDSESPATIAELAPAGVPLVMSSDAWEDYGVPVAPYFALVDGDEVVGEGAAGTWQQVTDLLGKALADAGHSLERGRGAAGTTRRGFLTGQQRAERIDSELAAAGIEPGDPRLYEPLSDPPPGRDRG
jgi:hypothetical protein